MFRIKNQSKGKRNINLDLIGQLSMKSSGDRLKGMEYAGRDMLHGKLGSWDLMIFLSGNTRRSADTYPCLTSECIFDPAEENIRRWIAVIGPSQEEALSKIEYYIGLDWEGVISRSKITRQGRIEIETGNEDRDFAFALAQKEARSICYQYISSGTSDPDPTKSLTPIQIMCLLEALAPIEHELGLKLLKNALQRMNPDKNYRTPEQIGIDQPPDLPLVSEIIARLVDLHGIGILDHAVIKQLERSLKKWFLVENDQDLDGIPELRSPDQFNLISLKDIKEENQYERIGHFPYLESPGLAAVLNNDLNRFIGLEDRFGKTDSNHHFDHYIALLSSFIHDSWNEDESRYITRDRDTHKSLSGMIIVTDPSGPFTVLMNEFSQPSRIGMLIEGRDIRNHLSELCITFHGANSNGQYRIEQIKSNQVQFMEGCCWGISETPYISLDYVTVRGLGGGHSLVVFQSNSDREDISQLLPLWEGTINDSRAEELIENTILNPDKYWAAYGLRSFPDPSSAAVQLSWNALLGRGLVRYGKREIAAVLFNRLIESIIINLNERGTFFEAYEANTGKGIGARNSPLGLVPIGFFLEICGVKIRPGCEIILKGEYPFLWPLRLHYQGILIHRGPDQTRIEIPGEQPRVEKGYEKVIIPLQSSPSENFST
jgi:hypothetical protein